MGKRPLSLLFACILVFSLMPAVALAINVNFDVSGSDETIAAQSVDVGKKVTEPRLSIVSRAYYVFKGWYKDAALTQPWRFSTVITDDDTDLTLYAAWVFTPGTPSSSGSTTGGYSYNNYSPSSCNPSVYYPADYYYYPADYYYPVATNYTAPYAAGIPKTGDAVSALPYLCLALSAVCAGAFALRRKAASN